MARSRIMARYLYDYTKNKYLNIILKSIVTHIGIEMACIDYIDAHCIVLKIKKENPFRHIITQQKT